MTSQQLWSCREVFLRVKPIYLLLSMSLILTPQVVAQAQENVRVAETEQRERDATAAALVRLINQAIEPDRRDGFNKEWGEPKSAEWSAVYRPSSRNGFLLDAIRVQGDQEVEMERYFVAPNMSIGDLQNRDIQKVRPGFFLSVEPYLSPAEYARLQAKNKEISRQLAELRAQMKDIKRQHKSGKYLPANEAEKRRVEIYEKLEATLTRKFPDFYFRDISLSWSSGFSYDSPYGYNPEYILETQDKEDWELEQAQVARKVVKLLTRYAATAE